MKLSVFCKYCFILSFSNCESINIKEVTRTFVTNNTFRINSEIANITIWSDNNNKTVLPEVKEIRESYVKTKPAQPSLNKIPSKEKDFNNFQNGSKDYTKIGLTDGFDNSSSLKYVPETWQDFCTVLTDSPTNGIGITNVTVTCEIGQSERLDFLSFRNFTSHFQENALFSITLTCHHGEVFLPKHAKARLLYSLAVVGCLIIGYYSEAMNAGIDKIQDSMVSYNLINCTIFMDREGFIHSLKSKYYSETYQCGPLNATSITERNISFYYDTSANLTDLLGNANKDQIAQKKVSLTCVYEKLLYLEKSNMQSMAEQSFINRMQYGVYPNIKTFNFADIGLSTIPSEFRKWRYAYPYLDYVDLRYNDITEIGAFKDHSIINENPGIGTIDLRFNNIRSITHKEIVLLLANNASNLLTVDFRNNPFNCICGMKDFIEYMKEHSSNISTRYMYLTKLKCHKPLTLRGKIIIDLTLEEIGCEILKNSILKGPIVVLCCFIIVSSASVIIGIRYRKEIIILAYTRLNILLPCQQKGSNVQKKYDAFIAYSEADTSWVVHTLTKRLENPDNETQRFHLCLHHRDFVVGATIADNIIQSVENSRHTVIIVSKHFLKSEWCRLEFQIALHQSLLEKKRHLIIVLLEDIPTNEFDSELKRCMQTLTYVKADDRWFWDKLVYALSDWTKRPRKRRNSRTNSKVPRNANYINANHKIIRQISVQNEV